MPYLPYFPFRALTTSVQGLGYFQLDLARSSLPFGVLVEDFRL